MSAYAMFPYTLIDLTHIMHEAIPSWEGGCGFQHTISLDYNDCNSEVTFRVQDIRMQAGIGTHMDAPAHCIPGGATIEQLPLQKLALPCIMIDVSAHAHTRYKLSVQDIERFEKHYGTIPSGSCVMIRTGWERFWDEPAQYRNNYLFPSISREAAHLLLARDIAAIGIDTLSPDLPEDGHLVHAAFLGAGKYIIENAAHLALLPPVGSFIMALPLKIKEGTEAPIRLIALISKR